ncbi:MAG: YkgJ family cysteine cluster protein, partial [Desulfobacterales bacterium]|nr:YkgJ family cysteine cluster protein [Desulfobacterales bacterium]
LLHACHIYGNFKVIRPVDSQNKSSDQTDTRACRRCGTCCRKGGPAFHLADRPLIEKGTIPLRHLFTIRKGERAKDPIRGVVRPVSTELIKLKGSANTWTCTFFNERDSSCRIYTGRPLECRLLKCWDTTDVEEMTARECLTRRHLLEGVAGLWDLVAEHEARCSCEKLAEMMAHFKKERQKRTERAIAEILNYDRHLRRLVVEKSRIDPEILDFLFGRPLEKILAMV